MAEYEIRQELSQKVNRYELSGLTRELDSQKHYNQLLARDLSFLQAKYNNHYIAIEKLIDLLSERPEFAVLYNELQTLKQYL